MMIVFMSRASSFFSALEEGCFIRLFQEAGIVDISLSFDDDCDHKLLLLFPEIGL